MAVFLDSDDPVEVSGPDAGLDLSSLAHLVLVSSRSSVSKTMRARDELQNQGLISLIVPLSTKEHCGRHK